MRILGCILKPVVTFVALAAIVLFLNAALPDSPGVMRLLGALVTVLALMWVGLTIWWSLRLRPPRPKPRPAP